MRSILWISAGLVLATAASALPTTSALSASLECSSSHVDGNNWSYDTSCLLYGAGTLDECANYESHNDRKGGSSSALFCVNTD